MMKFSKDLDNLKIPSEMELLLNKYVMEHPNLTSSRDLLTELVTQAFNLGIKYSSDQEILLKLSAMETKMDSLLRPQTPTTSLTYAQKLNSKANHTVEIKHNSENGPKKEQIILLYPKEPTDPDVIKKNLSTQVVKASLNVKENNLGIIRLHEIKRGGVLIEARDKKDIDKIENMISSKLSDNVSISRPQLRNPEIRIKNIEKDMNEDEIIPLIIKQNNIDDHLCKNLLSCKFTTTRFGRKDAIITVRNPLFNILLNSGKIYLGFSRLEIIQNIYIRTCLTCFNTGHSKHNCPLADKVVCRKCGKDHKTDNCTSKSSTCWRCSTYSHQTTPQHKFGSDNCVIFQNEAKKLLTITNYNDFNNV